MALFYNEICGLQWKSRTSLAGFGVNNVGFYNLQAKKSAWPRGKRRRLAHMHWSAWKLAHTNAAVFDFQQFLGFWFSLCRFPSFRISISPPPSFHILARNDLRALPSLLAKNDSRAFSSPEAEQQRPEPPSAVCSESDPKEREKKMSKWHHFLSRKEGGWVGG